MTVMVTYKLINQEVWQAHIVEHAADVSNLLTARIILEHRASLQIELANATRHS